MAAVSWLGKQVGVNPGAALGPAFQLVSCSRMIDASAPSFLIRAIFFLFFLVVATGFLLFLARGFRLLFSLYSFVLVVFV